MSISVLTQVLTVALSFVTRTVFVATLGVELLGVHTLLLSVLAMLAVADLGVSTAIMYALYKPLKDGDTSRVTAIVAHAAKLFRCIAAGVALVGVALLPFLDYLVNFDRPVEHLNVYYLVLLVNSVITYMMMNRVMLLNADQRIYLTKIYTFAFTVICTVVQIIGLVVWGSFFWYLVIQVVFTILKNLFIFVRVGKLYPYLKTQKSALVKAERQDIMRSVRAALVYRVAGLALNNSGPILVSSTVGTLALGYYSNYLLIVGSVVMITEVVFVALTPSVGNVVASGAKSSRRAIFDEIALLALIVHGTLGVAMMVMLSDFVELWLGDSYVLSPYVVAAVIFNFYIVGTQMPLWSFRSATGLFRETQYVIAVTAIVAIGLSLIMGKYLGLAGVIAAPAIARLATIAWYEPFLLIHRHLSGTSLSYFVRQFLAVAIWIICGAVAFGVGVLIPTGPLGQLLFKTALLLLLLPSAIWLVYGRTVAFTGLLGRVHAVLRH